MYFNDLYIDINKLINSGLTIEAYFVLKSISEFDKDLLESYVKKCGKISDTAINQLINMGYINKQENEKTITFNSLKITDKGSDYLKKDKIDYDKLFTEFKSIFPIKTPRGRRLHLNQDGCKSKYRTMVDSLKTHSEVIGSLKLEIIDREKNGQLEFMNAMPVWINQRNYKVYLDEFLNINNNNVDKNEDYDIV